MSIKQFWRWPALRRLSWRRVPWRRPSLAVNVALGVLVLAGAVLSYRTVRVADAAAASTGTSNRTVAVSQGTVTQTVSASGTVQSSSTANANFLTSGTVTEIDVHVGDVVKTGQTLAKVNPAAANEQLAAAQANLAAAQQSYTRATSAATPDAATVAAAQAQVTQAQNSVAAAQRALTGTVLTAPMDGTVIAVNGTVGGSSGSGASSSGSGNSGSGGSGGGGSGAGGAGNSGNSGGAATGGSSGSSGSTGFVQLADLTKMQVSASFAEADATKLKADQTATVVWSALAGARAQGRIATISPTATTQNNVNSYGVTITLDSLPDGIRIGQTTTVSVLVAQSDDVIRVPVAAVRTSGNAHTVDVVGADGSHETRRVEVGVQGDQFVEITSGLDVGERVALNTATTGGTNGRNGFTGGGGGFTGGGGGFTGGGNGGNTGGGNRGNTGRGGGG
jgi:membrane fusion protein, macrolide-specific efflux system